MARFFFHLIVLCLALGCKSDELYLLEDPELVFRIRSGILNTDQVENFYFKEKSILKKDFLKLKDRYGKNYLTDKNGVIKEITLRKRTYKDDLLAFQLSVDKNSIFEKFEMNSVDCEEVIAQLEEIFNRDQQPRNDGIDMEKKDSINQQIIVPFLEKCGIPEYSNINFLELSALFLVIQHADKDIMAYFYPLFECAAIEGSLPWGLLALMRDRLMVYNGKDQIYGTQHASVGTYKILDSVNVNKRRAEIGMGPLKK